MVIDVSLISKAEGRIIGFHWYEMLERFYSNPEIEAKFQEWVKEKNEKELKSGKKSQINLEQSKTKKAKRTKKSVEVAQQTAWIKTSLLVDNKTTKDWFLEIENCKRIRRLRLPNRNSRTLSSNKSWIGGRRNYQKRFSWLLFRLIPAKPATNSTHWAIKEKIQNSLKDERKWNH